MTGWPFRKCLVRSGYGTSAVGLTGGGIEVSIDRKESSGKSIEGGRGTEASGDVASFVDFGKLTSVCLFSFWNLQVQRCCARFYSSFAMGRICRGDFTSPSHQPQF